MDENQKSIRERSKRSICRTLTTEAFNMFASYRHSNGEVYLEIRTSIGTTTLLPHETIDLYEMLKLALDKADE